MAEEGEDGRLLIGIGKLEGWCRRGPSANRGCGRDGKLRGEDPRCCLLLEGHYEYNIEVVFLSQGIEKDSQDGREE